MFAINSFQKGITDTNRWERLKEQYDFLLIILELENVPRGLLRNLMNQTFKQCKVRLHDQDSKGRLFKLFIFHWGIVDITLSVSGVQQCFSICIQYEAIILISLVTIWNLFKNQTKDWCQNWSYNTLATWCKKLTHWKRCPCWESLRAEGEGDDRGWDGWMASLTRWTWVWTNFGRLSEGQRSLACCNPWGCKELFMTDQLNNIAKKKKSAATLTAVVAVFIISGKRNLNTDGNLQHKFYFVFLPRCIDSALCLMRTAVSGRSYIIIALFHACFLNPLLLLISSHSQCY